MPKFNKKSASSKKPLFISLCILTAIVLIIGLFLIYRHHNTKPLIGKTADGQTVNLAPPNQQEKSQNDTYKESIVNDSKTPTTPTTSTDGSRKSSVIVTSASATTVSAYVTGVFEDGGTCTATATLGSRTVTKSSVGFQNASYSQCAPITWDNPLDAGTWTLVVTYKSAATTSSQTTTIKV